VFRLIFWLVLPLACLAQPSSYTISTIAGNNIPGFSGDNGAATSAELNTPIGIALDSQHNIYIADAANERIRKVTVSTGKISTVAGSSGAGWTGDGGPATSATLANPYGVWIDAQGNMDITDLLNQVVRQVSPGGTIQTIAGEGNIGGYGGDGSPATSATMEFPWGVVTDAQGDLFISDSNDNRIREVTPDGIMHTYAGNGVGGYSGDGGSALSASIHQPFGLAVDGAGNLYFADYQNNRIREVLTNGTIKTVAGTGQAGFSGDGGPATSAKLNAPYSVAVDSSGDLFIADYFNNRIREVNAAGIISTIAGTGAIGYSGDSGAATSAKLNFPTGVAVDSSSGKVYVVDSSNAVIRLLTPQSPSSAGVTSASDFGNFPSVAPGSWIQIYGSNLSLDARQWTGSDFTGTAAPTSLDNTTVTIGGLPAAVDYISGGQVNAQVPSGVTAGSQPVVVKTPIGASAAFNVTVNSLQPGLWAPASFTIGGVSYVGALFPDGVTYVLPTGAIPGIPSRPAKAGDTIVLYGVGFGPVIPNIASGQIVQQSNTLATPVQFNIGSNPATAAYSGLAQTFVGLYQFNLIVPTGTTAGNTPLTFTLGGAQGTQKLYLATQ